MDPGEIQAKSRLVPDAKSPVCVICEITLGLIWIYACYSVGGQVCEVLQTLCLCVLSGFMAGQQELVRLCNCMSRCLINASVFMSAAYQSSVCTFGLIHHNLTHLLTLTTYR